MVNKYSLIQPHSIPYPDLFSIKRLNEMVQGRDDNVASILHCILEIQGGDDILGIQDAH